MTVNHIDDFKFVVVYFYSGGRSTIFNHDDVKTFVGQAAHGGTHALISKDACHDDVLNPDIA